MFLAGEAERGREGVEEGGREAGGREKGGGGEKWSM